MREWAAHLVHAGVEDPVDDGDEDDDDDGVEGVETRGWDLEAAHRDVHPLALEQEGRGHLGTTHTGHASEKQLRLMSINICIHRYFFCARFKYEVEREVKG